MSKEVVSGNKESEYIQRAALGDHDAFRQLVVGYEMAILTYLHSILGDWENARDVTQETFIAAFYALPHWQPPERLNQSSQYVMNHPLAPWLYRIATNRALTFLKQRNRHKAITSLHDEQHADVSQSGGAVIKHGDSVEAWENQYVMREVLHEALSQLAEDDAACIVLRFVDGERYTEIAERLGTTKEAVRKRVTRGLVMLRAAYKSVDLDVK